MHRSGHYGAALLTYTPVAVLAATIVTPQTLIVGAIVTVGFSTLPDVDLRLPFVRHRGITHTVWFASVAGILLTICIAVATTGFILALYLGGVSTLSVCSHLLADALTPIGICPFEPFWSPRYSLNIVPSKNPVVNYSLFIAGIAVNGSAAAEIFQVI